MFLRHVLRTETLLSTGTGVMRAACLVVGLLVLSSLCRPVRGQDAEDRADGIPVSLRHPAETKDPEAFEDEYLVTPVELVAFLPNGQWMARWENGWVGFYDAAGRPIERDAVGLRDTWPSYLMGLDDDGALIGLRQSGQFSAHDTSTLEETVSWWSTAVLSCARDSRGKHLAIARSPGDVGIYAARTGELLASRSFSPARQVGLQHLDLSRDRLFFSDGGDFLVSDIATGDVRRLLRSGDPYPHSVFDATHDVAVIWGVEDDRGSTRSVVHVLDTAGLSVERSFNVEGVLSTLAVSPGGRFVVFATEGRVGLRELAGQKEFSFPGLPKDARMAQCCALSQDGTRLAVGFYSGKVLMWDLTKIQGGAFVDPGPLCRTLAQSDARSGQAIWPVPDHLEEGPVGHIAYIADGNRALIWSPKLSNVIRLDLREMKVEYLYAHDASVVAMRVGPNGREFLTCQKDGAVWLWNVADDKCVVKIPGEQTGGATDMFFIPKREGDFAFYGGTTDLSLWSRKEKRIVQSFEHEQKVVSAAVSPDGTRILSLDYEGKVYCWDVESGEPVWPGKSPGGWFMHGGDCAISPDGSLGATTSDYSVAVIWDMESGAVESRLIGVGRGGVTFMGSRRRLLAYGHSWTANRNALWNLTLGSVQQEQEGEEFVLCWSGDGQRYVTIDRWAYGDRSDRHRKIYIRSGSTGALLHVVEIGAANVIAAGLSLDGARLATCMEDGKLYEWDLEAARE